MAKGNDIKACKRGFVFVIIAAIVIYAAAIVAVPLRINLVDIPILITITVCLLITLLIRFA